LNFKGGKGVATFVGLLFAAMWQTGLVFGAAWLFTAFVFRMSSFAALVATLVVPIFAWWLNPLGDDWIVFGVLAVLIYWRHRANIQRLLNGTEPKIGAKKQAQTSPDTP
jgi:glycerol-3-phosphate acyltransferase PlsY